MSEHPVSVVLKTGLVLPIPLIGDVAITAVINRYPEFDLVTENLRRDPRRMGRYEENVVQG